MGWVVLGRFRLGLTFFYFLAVWVSNFLPKPDARSNFKPRTNKRLWSDLFPIVVELITTFVTQAGRVGSDFHFLVGWFGLVQFLRRITHAFCEIYDVIRFGQEITY